MSMILDALTRAEHERQVEKQPDLKFTNHVKPQDKKPNNIWVWVACILVFNALILFFVIRALNSSDEQQAQLASPEPVTSTIQSAPVVADSNEKITLETQTVNDQSLQSAAATEMQENLARPLAMEVDPQSIKEVDRPLIYEAKQAKPKQVTKAQPKQTTNLVKKGNVSFSSTQLSADGVAPINDKPRLLIDQGEEAPVLAQAQTRSISSAPSLQDLPNNTRSKLKQYEVNVHVYDDDPIRRFVLINMDKYKEGDRIANNGPLVEEITANGVVIDYGNGRTLLPPK